jgi:plasmid stabilization system protein ParE
MTNVHENLVQTELEVMRWSRKAPRDREEQFRSFGERFMTAALFSGAALSRIATIERERPRR